MRAKFFDVLLAKMKEDKEIFFITADMGINLVEPIQQEFPERFINCGIAEQNAIGVAAGLAEVGYKPYVYSISNFITTRVYEHIRNDLVLHNLPVTLVGTSTGFDNGPLGPTHHAVDDWGILRNFAQFEIFCPYSKSNIDSIFKKILVSPNPRYIRIPKGNGIENQHVSIDYLLQLKNKKNRLVISYGSAANFAIKFAESSNSDILLIDLLNPLEDPSLLEILSHYSTVVVIEDHFSHTGMFGSLAVLKAKFKLELSLESIGPDNFLSQVIESSDAYFDSFVQFK